VEVTVRLFAMLRERAGAGEMVLELPEGASVRDALDRLGDLAEGLPLVMAVNREYAPEHHVLDPGDELALIPPVSGGDPEPIASPWVRVTEQALSLDGLAARVVDPRAGAVVCFQGVTREVERLEYEAYTEMAEPRMREIATAAIERHGLCAAAVEHRVGAVALSEPSVTVAVSSPHRGEAFAGAREIIDRVKADAPIWKKEIGGGEEGWVGGAVPGPGLDG
jgi:molybdopterin synthase catalytic subunit